MSSIIILIKHTIIKQTRSTNYLLMIIISIFLGLVCVPGLSDGYEIFYLGGVRGIYNSSWLGAMAAMLPVILLWLPGFYLLRSQISEDRRFKVGQIIASAPISKLRYIGGKFLCNFAVLLSSALIFNIAVIGMQLFRQESLRVSLIAYLMPFLLITVPYLLVLAALTVFFDVISGLKGVFGNIVIFIVWLLLAGISLESPGNTFDLFGIGYILKQMQMGARAVYSGLPDAASFGYYPNEGIIQTFTWDGIMWEQGFITTRLMWIGIAFILVIVSAIVFDRFRLQQSKKGKKARKTIQETSRTFQSLTLSPVTQSRYVNFFIMLKGELKIMLTGKPVWWYLTVLTSIGLSYFVVIGEGLKWISLILLLPIGIWSQMGCREKFCGTTQLIDSSCSKVTKWIVNEIAGMLSALMISSGILLRFAMDGLWENFLAWCIGVLFLTTLALVCGSLSWSSRLFEGICIALLYMGPLNGMWQLDFLGVQSIHTAVYGIALIVLIFIGVTKQLADGGKIFAR